MIEEKIENLVTNEEWSFASMLKLKDLSHELAEKLYDTDLTSNEIIDLIWEEQLEIKDYSSFGELYKTITIKVLETKIMEAFQKHFENATVNFNNKIKKEPKPIIEKPKKTPKPNSNKKEKEEFVKTDDGTNLPKGVKRV
tara:strand:+ start:1686 stop:2105 length:420 start_codon:yes stop_codon:yes gene_type:complete